MDFRRATLARRQSFQCRGWRTGGGIHYFRARIVYVPVGPPAKAGTISALHDRVQERPLGGLLDMPAECGPKRFEQLGRRQKCSNRRHDIGVSRPRIEKRPAILAVGSTTLAPALLVGIGSSPP